MREEREGSGQAGGSGGGAEAALGGGRRQEQQPPAAAAASHAGQAALLTPRLPERAPGGGLRASRRTDCALTCGEGGGRGGEGCASAPKGSGLPARCALGEPPARCALGEPPARGVEGGVGLNSEEGGGLEDTSGSRSTSDRHWDRVLWQAPIGRRPGAAAAAEGGGRAAAGGRPRTALRLLWLWG